MNATKKKTTIRGRCLNAMIICVVVVVGLTAGKRLYDQIQLAHLINKLDIVVSQIKSGSLKVDKDGNITLPSRFAKLSATGRVYRSHDADDPQALFFPSEDYEGLLAGYVYCESPPFKRFSPGLPWLDFQFSTSENEGVMLYPLEAPKSFCKSHPYWFWAEPFY